MMATAGYYRPLYVEIDSLPLPNGVGGKVWQTFSEIQLSVGGTLHVELSSCHFDVLYHTSSADPSTPKYYQFFYGE